MADCILCGSDAGVIVLDLGAQPSPRHWPLPTDPLAPPPPPRGGGGGAGGGGGGGGGGKGGFNFLCGGGAG